MSLRSIGCGLGLATGTTAAILILVEVLLRLFAPQPLLHDPDAFEPDPVLGARLRPGFQDRAVTTEFASTWKINDKGYRGPAAQEGESPALRIVAAGDSFTFGYGVEEAESWPRLLESHFTEADDGGSFTEVLNLGVGGYGTWQEALWLQRQMPSLRPDIVVVAFYVGNDPSDNLRTVASSRNGQPGGAVPERPRRVESIKRWLGSRLHVYNLVSTRADELLVTTGLRKLVLPFEMEVLLDPEPPHVREAWQTTRIALERLAEVCRDGGARLLLVTVPMKHQVDDSVWSRLTRYYARLAGGEQHESALDRFRPQRRLLAMAREAGIDTLDLTDDLREAQSRATRDNAFYWPRDQHWNVSGHAEAAGIIGRRLREIVPRLRDTGSE